MLSIVIQLSIINYQRLDRYMIDILLYFAIICNKFMIYQHLYSTYRSFWHLIKVKFI